MLSLRYYINLVEQNMQIDKDKLGDLEDQAYELESKYESYLHGDCHLLALALHSLTNKPIHGAVEYDQDIDRDAMVHVWIQWNDTFALDAGCLRSVKYMMQDFSTGFVDIIVVNDKVIKNFFGNVSASDIQQAMPAAKAILALAEQQIQAGILLS